MKKNMVTSSYIWPAVGELHEKVKQEDLIFINECGLDPGIDIMSTIKVRDEFQEKGCKIIGYESYCGGLPAAENADNPLGYKFSWAPASAIKATMNPAK